jgi:hypothetical protein
MLLSLCFCLIAMGDWGLLWPLVILVVVMTDLNEKSFINVDQPH